jgi:hypothetical protein
VGRTCSCWMLNCWCVTWPAGFKRLNQLHRTVAFVHQPQLTIFHRCCIKVVLVSVWAGLAQWVRWLGYELDDRGCLFPFPKEQEIVLFSKISRPILGPNQPIILRAHVAIPWSVKWPRLEADLTPPRFRMCGVIPHSSILLDCGYWGSFKSYCTVHGSLLWM